jgi:hypothetical protein
MYNTQTQNDSQNKVKASLRGEAPQVHGVKSKKQKKVNPETVAARQLLIAMSQEAQDFIESGLEVEGFEECEKVNDYLLVMHQQATGCETFKTFHEWKKAGYSVKRDMKAFRIWGSPVKAKKAEAQAQAESDTDAENTFKYWPMCCLFNESQVERIEGNEEPQKTEKKEPQAAPAEQETKAAEKVKVSEFRGKIEHLERVFNVDRHACVGDKEKADWCGRVKNVLADLEGMECPRAKSDDLERCASIIAKVKAYLVDSPEPTPPKPSKKSQESKNEAASESATNYTQDMGNNESLTRGLFPQAGGDFVAMTFSESKTFKTRAGAERWLAVRGLDASGRSIEEQAEEEAETGEASPFVTTNYQEEQEARKDRMIERSDKATAEFQATYNRAKDMASVIPFGQPILVGHHSEKRDRKYRDKIHNTFGKAFELDGKAEHYQSKAAAVGTGGIATNDPEAVTKLKDKLAGLEKSQETMKAVNKIIRSKKLSDAEKVAEIEAAGLLTATQAEVILKPDHCNRVGYASYSLSNNSAEIRRIKSRLAELERLRNSTPLEFENDDFSLCVDDGRVCFEFSGGKPSEEVRKLLSGAAFKWSRFKSAWVRKATANATAETGRLLERLKAVEGIY